LKQLAFEELMTVILTNFAICSHDEIDACIQEALQKISTLMGIERAYLIIAKLEYQKTWSTIREWYAPHIKSRLNECQEIPFGTFPWSEKKLLEGDVNSINTLDDYPPDAYAERQFNQAEGIQSILNVPIGGSSETISGCIGVNMYSRSVTWTDDDVNHLKIVGDAIANLLERKRAEELLLKAYDTTLEGWAKADTLTSWHGVVTNNLGVSNGLNIQLGPTQDCSNNLSLSTPLSINDCRICSSRSIRLSRFSFVISPETGVGTMPQAIIPPRSRNFDIASG